MNFTKIVCKNSNFGNFCLPTAREGTFGMRNFLKNQFRPARWVPDSCIKLNLEYQFRPAEWVPYILTNAVYHGQCQFDKSSQPSHTDAR